MIDVRGIDFEKLIEQVTWYVNHIFQNRSECKHDDQFLYEAAVKSLDTLKKLSTLTLKR